MSLLDPSSIAVIGASETPGKVGHTVFQNLQTQGFTGKLFPVNPKYTELLGSKCFPSVSDIPEEVEMAVIVIPAAHVPAALEECGKKNVKYVTIISAGFSENHTEEGKKLEDEITRIAGIYEMKVMGPNCLGYLCPHSGLNASFAAQLPAKGNVAFISQSGALAVALMEKADTVGLGFSSVFSIGNKACMDECDFLEICADDENTKVIGLYLEDISDGKRFTETAKRISKKKPIVLLKGGVSVRGQKAASSHTGALAGSDAAIDAACTEAGITRAHTSQECIDALLAFSFEPPLLSPNIAIITNAGGLGILATDATEKNTLSLPELPKAIAEDLKKKLPAAASISNPIDILGDADETRYEAALDACGQSKTIDGIALLLTPQAMTPVEKIADVIADWKKKYPLMPITCAFMGGDSLRGGKHTLWEHGIPVFDTAEQAIHALGILKKKTVRAEKPEPLSDLRKVAALEILRDQKGILSQEKMEELFALYDLPLPRAHVARSTEEAVQFAEAIGYPVIAKIHSPTILHKTDIGGVEANLQSAEEVQNACERIAEKIQKSGLSDQVDGVLIQEFLAPGTEFIIGGHRDPGFGPLIMVGLGGIYAELFKDVTFRLAPVTPLAAFEMLEELTAAKLLKGMRGKVLDIEKLADMVVRCSELIAECEVVETCDFNPVIVREKGVDIVDCKIIL